MRWGTAFVATVLVAGCSGRATLCAYDTAEWREAQIRTAMSTNAVAEFEAALEACPKTSPDRVRTGVALALAFDTSWRDLQRHPRLIALVDDRIQDLRERAEQTKTNSARSLDRWHTFGGLPVVIGEEWLASSDPKLKQLGRSIVASARGDDDATGGAPHKAIGMRIERALMLQHGLETGTYDGTFALANDLRQAGNMSATTEDAWWAASRSRWREWWSTHTLAAPVIDPECDDPVARAAIDDLEPRGDSCMTYEQYEAMNASGVTPGAIEWSGRNHWGNNLESTPMVPLYIARTNGTNGRVSVDVRVVGGTATLGQDYRDVSKTVVFCDGQWLRAIQLQLIDDAAIEPNETIELELRNPSGGAMLRGVKPGNTSKMIVTVRDNDSPPDPVSADEKRLRASRIVALLPLDTNSAAQTVDVLGEADYPERGLYKWPYHDVLPLATLGRDGEAPVPAILIDRVRDQEPLLYQYLLKMRHLEFTAVDGDVTLRLHLAPERGDSQAAAMANAEQAAKGAPLASLVRASDTIIIGTLHTWSGYVDVVAWEWLVGTPAKNVHLRVWGEHGTSPSGKSAWNAKTTGQRVLLFMKPDPDEPKRVGPFADHASYLAADSTYSVLPATPARVAEVRALLARIKHPVGSHAIHR